MTDEAVNALRHAIIKQMMFDLKAAYRRLKLYHTLKARSIVYHEERVIRSSWFALLSGNVAPKKVIAYWRENYGITDDDFVIEEE